MFRLFQRIAWAVNWFFTFQQSYDNPASTLPDGFVAGPNIRQGRLGRSWKNEDYFWSEKPPPFVTTKLGSYEGYFMRVISGRDVYAFEGIAYAEKPERFKNPVSKKPFKETFSAKSPGHDCAQTFFGTITVDHRRIFVGSEDCLTCNVYTPEIKNGSNDPKLPVILNIYGGSFAVGSARDYGPSYLLEQDVVLVNCNYRVGVLGFLSTGDKVAPGNWGLKDLALAVDWIHDNIQEFGGDPKRIIILGQSAGAVLGHLLIMSPRVKEKAAGLVALSGNAFVHWAVMDKELATRMTWRFAVMNFCPTNQGNLVMVNCLRKRNSYVLEAFQNIVHITEQWDFQFSPVIEPETPSSLLTKSPEELYFLDEVRKIPAIFSVNARDSDGLNMILTQLGGLPTLTRSLLALSPQLLGYRGKVDNEFDVEKKIIEFYGGIKEIENNKNILFDLIQDRMFRNGMWKSIKFHSKLAPTFAQTFAYRSRPRSVARRFRLPVDVFDYGVPHGEDLFYIFNRTDIPPISRTHEDFGIVKLFQTELTNFATDGKPRYTFGELEDVNIIEEANPRTKTFKMLIIDRELKTVEMPFETNVTKFWDSLNI